MTGPSSRPVPDAAPAVVAFARTLRAAGLAADPARTAAFARAASHLAAAPAEPAEPAGSADEAAGRAGASGDPRVRYRDALYWAGRVTLCAGPGDIAVYDRSFAAFFGGGRRDAARSAGPARGRRGADLPGGGGRTVRAERTRQGLAASGTDVVRTADLGLLSPAERAEVGRLVSLIRVDGPRRRSRRRTAARRGAADHRRTLALAARTGGEPVRIARRRRADRPRKVVALLDVSGSMSPYAEAHLRFAHALVRGRPAVTEVFSVGTRLTRLTRELSTTDPARALRSAGRAVPDWSGGTRLGAELRRFLDVHGRAGAARGALVVIASDGWERGDAALLGAQLERLSRLAHRVVWVNPHRAQPGYAPLAAGMAAALPHVDDFVSGHSLDALERLAAVVTGRGGQGGPRA